MQAVVFEDCAGWLHRAPAIGGALGVVLCSPFGHEAIWTHEGFRQLADRLADAGMSTLRFDYRGTGDSADGDVSGEQQLRQYADDIVAAAAQLKAATGVDRIALCGMRMGGTLAALVASRIAGVEALVMLAPVTNGRHYLRELKILQQTFLETAGPFVAADQTPGDGVDTLGHRLCADTVAAVLALDLAGAPAAPAPQVLLLSPGLRPADATLAARYEALGSHVQVQDFPERDAWMVDPMFSVPPEAAMASVTGWLDAIQGRLAARSHVVAALPSRPVLTLPHATERVVGIGEQGMVGIYCVPTGVRAAAPAVLFINTGKTHHIGNARLAVTFARSLALAGVASLRIDVGGIGDSAPPVHAADAESPYTGAAPRDVRAAVDWLARQGEGGVIVFGICSGAYLGLHAAADHPRIVAAMLVNLEWFFKPQKPVTQAAQVKRGVSTRLALISLKTPDKWLKVARGEASLLPIARLLLRGAGKRIGAECKRIAARLHPALSEDRRIDDLLHRLRAKGVYTRLVFGALDSGLDELETHFGRHGGRLPRSAHLQCTVFETMDHTLFSTPARQRLADFLERFVFETASAGARTATGTTTQKTPDLPRQPGGERGQAVTNGVAKNDAKLQHGL